MNELNTYQNLPGKVLKSATNKLKQPSIGVQHTLKAQGKLQDLLDLDALDSLIKSLLKNVGTEEDNEIPLQIFYQKFTQIILHIIAETKFANNINISSDEFLEIIRVSLEEQLNVLNS